MEFTCSVLVTIFFAAWIEISSGAVTTSTSTATPPPTEFHIGEKNITWHPDHHEKLIVTTDEGFKISVGIQYCVIDIADTEFVKIYTDKPEESIIVTGTVAASPKFLYNTDVLNLEFTGTKNSNVTFEFARIGDVITTTTTEPTSSTEFLPTPNITDTYELVVVLTGLAAYQYRNPTVLLDFAQMITNMAIDYCEDQQFELVDNITTNNVEIIGIYTCTTGWPSCSPCVEAKFAVPIHTKNDSETWPGYQLNQYHLQIMWERYSEKYLTDGITTCTLPSMNNWIKYRIILFFSVTAIFLIILLIMRYCSVKYSRIAGRNKKKIEGQNVTLSEEDAVHVDPLNEHYYQEKPPFLDVTQPMFESNMGLTNPVFELLPEPSSVLKKRRVFAEDQQELEVNNDENIGWSGFEVDV
ncbi:uncharacterized protein LOC126887436 [Diabrotica virgifera virgifera]|uniref:Uncharacterized protein n=1 Tax=Diabrotica virgifera virgifera TaxID=50390 RepID=A0ABM5KL52_DIAVI|nr:uncharacterized protein LOC126887436 [Diabrotica virgifera virgifera]